MDNPMNTVSPQFNLSLRTNGEAGLQKALVDAKFCGFDGVELPLPALGIVYGGKILTRACEHIARTVCKTGLGVSIHAPLSLNFMDTAHADMHMAVAKTTVQVAHSLGAKIVVLHPGWVSPQNMAAQAQSLMQTERDSLATLAEFAKSHNVSIALENMPVLPPDKSGRLTTYGLICKAIKDTVEAINHPALTSCLDVSHAAISATAHGSNLYDDIRHMAPHIGHMHLHDSFAQTGEIFTWTGDENFTFGQGDTHLPLGWGNINFTHLLKGLPVAQNLTVTLEIQSALQDTTTLKESLLRAKQATENLAILETK